MGFGWDYLRTRCHTGERLRALARAFALVFTNRIGIQRVVARGRFEPPTFGVWGPPSAPPRRAARAAADPPRGPTPADHGRGARHGGPFGGAGQKPVMRGGGWRLLVVRARHHGAPRTGSRTMNKNPQTECACPKAACQCQASAGACQCGQNCRCAAPCACGRGCGCTKG